VGGSANGSTLSATATCPVGQKLVGGGGTIVQGANAQAFLMESKPNPATGTPTGWTATAYQFANNGSNGNRWTITAYAVCGA
jgi:hypothetical protein